MFVIAGGQSYRRAEGETFAAAIAALASMKKGNDDLAPAGISITAYVPAHLARRYC
jgi:hypothetical protein